MIFELQNSNMTKLYTLFLVVFFVPFSSFCQGNIELSPEERAYLFHVVKKSPILDNSIGRYFEYKGPEVRLMNKELNYDSIENYIIIHPISLNIRTIEIGKSPKGIIAEAANKMAIWELNKTLLAARSSDKDLERYLTNYNRFESIVLSKLPPAAMKQEGDLIVINKKLLPVLNPSLSFDDKAAMLGTFHFLSPNEQLTTMEAINYAINAYVEERALEIYRALGGEAVTFKNILVAAGDGSETSGLLNEREKDESGKWNKGLPKAVGLFPYQVKLLAESERNKTNLDCNRFATIDLETVGDNKLTQIHFDVWGYNAKKQTTVVIERNGKSYHLFGASDTRFLSPDSTYSEGKTFQAIINELQNNQIAKLQERLYGKKGIEEEIKDAEKKKEETLLSIQKNEKAYSDLHRGTITTSNKVNKATKKAKKAAKKNPSKEFSAQPTTNSGRRPKGKKENDIVDLYGEYDRLKKLIADLNAEKQLMIDQLGLYQLKMDGYRRAMGYTWMEYTVKDGLYTFSDSATFDLYTQEFTFPADSVKTPFEIRLLSVPDSPVATTSDEVMLHVNLIDSKPGFDARVQVSLNDVFESNNWLLNSPLFSQQDSVAVRQFFEGMLDKKNNFEIIARGQGVGLWNGAVITRNPNREEQTNYPGATKEEQQRWKADSSYARLRSSEIDIFINRGIRLVINTYTDPVRTNLTPSNAKIAEQLVKYRLTGNDYLSALRSATLIQKLKLELNVLAGSYLTREEAKIVIDRLNKAIDNTRISCGATSFDWQELLGSK
jgi:hypothetical protein